MGFLTRLARWWRRSKSNIEFKTPQGAFEYISSHPEFLLDLELRPGIVTALISQSLTSGLRVAPTSFLVVVASVKGVDSTIAEKAIDGLGEIKLGDMVLCRLSGQTAQITQKIKPIYDTQKKIWEPAA